MRHFHPMLLGRAKALACPIEALCEVGPCAGGAQEILSKDTGLKAGA